MNYKTFFLLLVLLISLGAITSAKKLKFEQEYCVVGNDCTLNDLFLTGNFSFIGDIVNVTIINQNVTGQLSIGGNLYVADNLTVIGNIIGDGSLLVLSPSLWNWENNASSINDSVTASLSMKLENNSDVNLTRLRVKEAPVPCTVNYGMTYTNMTTSICSQNITPWFIIGSNLVYTGGNVGIGTTNPKGYIQISDKIVIVNDFTDEGITDAIVGLGAEGGEIFLPEGTYVIDSCMQVPVDNIMIRGSGRATIIDSSGYSLDCTFNLTSRNNIHLKDFQLKGNNADTGSDIYSVNSAGSEKTGIIIENIYFSQHRQYGIYLRYTDFSKVLDSEAENPNTGSYNYAWLYTYLADNIIVQNSLVTCQNTRGLWFVKGENIIVNTGKFEDCSYAIDYYGITKGVFFNNIVIDSTYIALSVRMDGTNLGHGIIISGNTIYDAGAGNYPGISISAIAGTPYKNAVITNNFIEYVSNGVLLVDSFNALVSGNSFKNADTGVWLDNNRFNNTGNVIVGNVFASDVTTTFHDEGVNNSYIIHHQGNVGIDTISPTYPLEVNKNVFGISIYASGNISADDYITRTSVFDTSKTVWDYIKSAEYYKDKDKIDHTKFYGYAGEFEITDYERAVKEEYIVEECNETFIINEIITECINITKIRITYPYKKNESGVSLNKEIDLLRQAIYELKQENDLIKTELCIYNNYNWC